MSEAASGRRRIVFQPSFLKQFRAVILKNIAEDFEHKVLLLFQIVLPVLFICIVAVYHLTIPKADQPSIDDGLNSIDKRDNTPFPSYLTLIKPDSGHGNFMFVDGTPNHLVGTAPLGEAEGQCHNHSMPSQKNRHLLWDHILRSWVYWQFGEWSCMPAMMTPPTATWEGLMKESDARVNDLIALDAFYNQQSMWNYWWNHRENYTRAASKVPVASFMVDKLVPETTEFRYHIYSAPQNLYSNIWASSDWVDSAILWVNSVFMRMAMHHTGTQSMEIDWSTPDMAAAVQKFAPVKLGALSIIDVIMQIFFFLTVMFLQIPFVMWKNVRERQTGLMQMLELMGLRVAAYWISSLIYNLVIYYATLFIVCLVSWVTGLSLLSNSWMALLLFVAWGPVQIAIGNVFSALFRRTGTALLCGYLAALATPLTCLILMMASFHGDSLPPWYFMILPPFAFCYGVFCCARHLATPTLFSTAQGNLQGFFALLFVVVFGVVWFMAGVYLDKVLPRKVGQRRSPIWPLKAMYGMIIRRVNNSHADEHKSLLPHLSSSSSSSPLVSTTSPSFSDSTPPRGAALMTQSPEGGKAAILVRDVTKTFGSKMSGNEVKALRGVSFDVEQGECFGLLGPNGAGKSTLVNILCGLTRPDSGTAFIGGYDLRYDIDRIQSMVGLCPQFDIHSEDLTVREHLLFYARIKGCPVKEESAHVEALINEVVLHNERRRLAGNLSGGQKRRLSLAIALTGNPAVVYLDEPSSALDPGSTREMWDILIEARKNRCFLLTTHSMQEADAICTRIGIVSQGQMKCIGTQQHLKTTYGQGYKVDIFCTPAHQQEAREFFTTLAPGAELVHATPTGLVYRLPKTTPLSDLFAQVEQHKYQHGIQNWAVTQSSLDEVFFSIVQADESAATSPAPAPSSASPQSIEPSASP